MSKKAPVGFQKARYRRIPCFFNKDTNELIGRNFLYNILMNIVLWFDINIIYVENFNIMLEFDPFEIRFNYDSFIPGDVLSYDPKYGRNLIVMDNKGCGLYDVICVDDYFDKSKLVRGTRYWLIQYIIKDPNVIPPYRRRILKELEDFEIKVINYEESTTK
jgi:hypothetical protein